MSGKTTYKKPPIIERVIGVYADIKIQPEVFEAKMPEWIAKIQDHYPISKPIAEWTLNIKEVKGVPMLQGVMPKAEIIQMFWKLHRNKQQVHGMRLRPDRLVFHVCREGDIIHDFDEIYVEMERWIGKWMEHFEVKALKGVTAEYFNRLNGAITPQFILPDGGIKIAEALVMFANIPGKYTTVTPPYDNKIRLIVDAKRPCCFDLRVMADDEVRSSLKIDFIVSTCGQEKAISAKDALDEIQIAHDVILEQFDCFFTKQAKESFVPYGIPDPKPSK
jgi:hypothetical protein